MYLKPELNKNDLDSSEINVSDFDTEQPNVPALLRYKLGLTVVGKNLDEAFVGHTSKAHERMSCFNFIKINKMTLIQN